MRRITWHIEKRKVSELIAADYNPRTMTPQERVSLKESISKFDAVVPGVVNIGKRENVLIGGHQRRVLYEEEKREEMDVMVPDRELTLDEEKELNLRLNKNTGSWDQEKLAEIGIDLLLEVGFGEEELAGMFDDVDVIDDDFNMAKAIKETKTVTTKLGDIWQLGEHRLMVGDSMNPEHVEKLMGGSTADMVFCDPPYNIGLDYTKGSNTGPKQKKAKEFRTGKAAYSNDKKSDKNYATLLDGTMTNALAYSKPNVHAFYWCDEHYIWMVQGLFAEHGLQNKRVCLWVKNNFSLTPHVAFNKCYEPCVYATRGKPFLNTAIRNLNEVLNKEIEAGNQAHTEILDILTLWLVKRVNAEDYEHPTQKPVTLAEKPLKRCTGAGGVVLDLFGGSGTTLIACTQLARKCRMMEIDPLFATIIIDRWEKFTNQKAKKV